ncbi:DUF3617 domain-containing protein [Thioalkalivibrio sp.]|uniref:DUF3617 domain-containing protein n=1 Tax=Thioalkalivibrio sp. TaxID=2093813 RepID=UPI00356A11FE
MKLRSLAIAAAAVLPLSALAVEPNIQPGEWELNSVTTFPGTPMPEQTESSRECVTAEDLAEGLAFDVDVEGCEITDMDLREGGMNYSMSCQDDEGFEMTMDAELLFMGDQTEGTMQAQMLTPMGPMEMHMELDGRRIGDC